MLGRTTLSCLRGSPAPMAAGRARSSSSVIQGEGDQQFTVSMQPAELDAIRAVAGAADDPPVAMLNLNRYKPEAGGVGGEGHAAYMALLYRAVEEVGGRVLWRVPTRGTVVGSALTRTDEVSRRPPAAPRRTRAPTGADADVRRRCSRGIRATRRSSTWCGTRRRRAPSATSTGRRGRGWWRRRRSTASTPTRAGRGPPRGMPTVARDLICHEEAAGGGAGPRERFGSSI